MTDFNKVIEHLKNALEELKKGEHDHLASFYERNSYSSKEIILILIRNTFTLKKRWESEPMEFGPDVEMCECGYHPKDDTMKCDL